MDPIEVTARFDLEGKATPLQFTWQGRDYSIESTGRRWESDQGQHILVMAVGGHVFEVLFVPQEMQWFLKEIGPGRKLI